jgi:hypothetical protein
MKQDISVHGAGQSCLSLSLAIIITVAFADAKDEWRFKPNLSFKLTGGRGSALPVGDINAQLESVNNNAAFVYWRQHDPSRVTGEITQLEEPLHLPEWEGELRIDMSPHISVGIATSPPYKTSKESSVRYLIIQGTDTQIVDYTYRPTIKIGPPIRFSIYYSFFGRSWLHVSFVGGIGLYPTTIKEYRKRAVTLLSGAYGYEERYIDTECNIPLGLHCGLDMEFSLFKNLTLVLEAQWRNVKLSNFKGSSQLNVREWTSAGELYTDRSTVENGTLYYLTEEDLYLGARYANVRVWDRVPEGSVNLYSDIRKATFDLKRSAVRIGLKIRLL